jgi:signal transduction histidine kinase
MKLFWKLLTGMLAMMILSFAIFGTILLQSSFRGSLEMEKENGMEEMRLFQYAFLSSLDGLTENIYAMDEATLRTLAESIGQNVGDGSRSFCLYNDKGEGIYPEGQRAGALFLQLDTREENEENCVWRVAETDGTHVMEALVKMEKDGTAYYLELDRDIEYVYENRSRMYRNYRVALLVLTGMGAIFSAFLAMTFTRPIYRLSRATRAFSNGNYDRRVKPQGNDELALLMRDFNRMADQLQENIRELQEAARRQEEFTGAFAHELKTPLTSMIGYGEMLATMELPEEDRRQAASYIYRESRRLERLAYKMMELIQVGNGEIVLQAVPMEQLGRELLRFTAASLREKCIRLQISFEKGTVAGDWDLLLSLFGNLVDNARKACNSGGEIFVSGKKCEDGGYQVKVCDNGCGMPEEEIHKIAEAFYMVDKSRARREGGAGLGMAICERIVKAHRADWTIESKEGQGTQITVLFPAAEVADEG